MCVRITGRLVRIAGMCVRIARERITGMCGLGQLGGVLG